MKTSYIWSCVCGRQTTIPPVAWWQRFKTTLRIVNPVNGRYSTQRIAPFLWPSTTDSSLYIHITNRGERSASWTHSCFIYYSHFPTDFSHPISSWHLHIGLRNNGPSARMRQLIPLRIGSIISSTLSPSIQTSPNFLPKTLSGRKSPSLPHYVDSQTMVRTLRSQNAAPLNKRSPCWNSCSGK